MLNEALDSHNVRGVFAFNLRENFLGLPKDDL